MKRIIGLAGAALIALTGLTGCSSELSEGEAMTVCQNKVTEELNDPASALYDDRYISARSTGKNHYNVTGKGRAANAFGGMVGFDFSCKVLKTSGGEVKVSTKIVDPWDD